MFLNSLISMVVGWSLICCVYLGLVSRSSNVPCGVRFPPWVSGFWRSSWSVSRSVFMVFIFVLLCLLLRRGFPIVLF